MNAPSNQDIWKSEFLMRISHEMRTPLTTIIGYSEVMLSDPKLPPEAKQEYVEIIRNAGKRLSEFLDTYLDSEVVQRNKKLSEKRQEDLSLLAQRAIEKVSTVAASKNVAITACCDAAIYLEEADPERIVQILGNLLSNAIELAPKDGHVEIIGSQTPRVIEINVVNKDRGFLSISATSASKMFRWIQSPGIEIHHDGLGLAFAKHVVELEGGLLNIQSLEQGLTFTLQFPRNSRN
jgi:signal transduction histidine kinase